LLSLLSFFQFSLKFFDLLVFALDDCEVASSLLSLTVVFKFELGDFISKDFKLID